jgi:hypothetical protein
MMGTVLYEAAKAEADRIGQALGLPSVSAALTGDGDSTRAVALYCECLVLLILCVDRFSLESLGNDAESLMRVIVAECERQLIAAGGVAFNTSFEEVLRLRRLQYSHVKKVFLDGPDDPSLDLLQVAAQELTRIFARPDLDREEFFQQSFTVYRLLADTTIDVFSTLEFELVRSASAGARPENPGNN